MTSNEKELKTLQLKNDLVSNLFINATFKNYVVIFLTNLIDIHEEGHALDYEVKTKDEESLILIVKSITFISKEIAYKLKRTLVDEKKKKYITLVKKIEFEDGRFWIELSLKKEKLYNTNIYKNKNDEEQKENNQELIKDIDLSFKTDDIKFHSSFINSDSYKKLVLLWNHLYNDQSLIQHSTKIIIDDIDHIQIKNIGDVLCLYPFYNKIDIFIKEKKIKSVDIKIIDGQLCLLVNLNGDTKRKQSSDNEEDYDNKKIKI